MEKFFFFILLSFLTCNSAHDAPLDSSFEAFQLNFRGHSFDIIRIELAKTDLRFFLADTNGHKYRDFENLKSALAKKNQTISFAMNGGMYRKDGRPQGLYIENKKTIQSLDTIQKAFGNFYLQPNGVFYIENEKAFVLSTNQFRSTNSSPEFATQSGPMLVIKNKVHSAFVEGSKNLNIRNGVGIDKERRVVFAISNEKLNLFDFAMLFKEALNCKNALYLDGFVSKAYIPSLDRNELGGNFGPIIGIVEPLNK